MLLILHSIGDTTRFHLVILSFLRSYFTFRDSLQFSNISNNCLASLWGWLQAQGWVTHCFSLPVTWEEPSSAGWGKAREIPKHRAIHTQRQRILGVLTEPCWSGSSFQTVSNHKSKSLWTSETVHSSVCPKVVNNKILVRIKQNLRILKKEHSLFISSCICSFVHLTLVKPIQENAPLRVKFPGWKDDAQKELPYKRKFSKESPKVFYSISYLIFIG